MHYFESFNSFLSARLVYRGETSGSGVGAALDVELATLRAEKAAREAADKEAPSDSVEATNNDAERKGDQEIEDVMDLIPNEIDDLENPEKSPAQELKEVQDRIDEITKNIKKSNLKNERLSLYQSQYADHFELQNTLENLVKEKNQILKEIRKDQQEWRRRERQGESPAQLKKEMGYNPKETLRQYRKDYWEDWKEGVRQEAKDFADLDVWAGRREKGPIEPEPYVASEEIQQSPSVLTGFGQGGAEVDREFNPVNSPETKDSNTTAETTPVKTESGTDYFTRKGLVPRNSNEEVLLNSYYKMRDGEVTMLEGKMMLESYAIYINKMRPPTPDGYLRFMIKISKLCDEKQDMNRSEEFLHNLTRRILRGVNEEKKPFDSKKYIETVYKIEKATEENGGLYLEELFDVTDFMMEKGDKNFDVSHLESISDEIHNKREKETERFEKDLARSKAKEEKNKLK